MDFGSLPRAAGERDTLVSFLEWQRATLARKCSGLSAEQMRRRAVEPSTLSLLGLLRHMAGVERWWFRRTLAQEDVPLLYSSDADPDADFNDLDTAEVDEALATWTSECERARAIVEAHDLDDTGRHENGQAVSLRWILVHMIEEYSRHNGHADLLRERIDGAVGYLP
ncbi:MAG: DinB family protein [Candidatus Dormibacteria bacterium]